MTIEELDARIKACLGKHAIEPNELLSQSAPARPWRAALVGAMEEAERSCPNVIEHVQIACAKHHAKRVPVAQDAVTKELGLA